MGVMYMAGPKQACRPEGRRQAGARKITMGSRSGCSHRDAHQRPPAEDLHDDPGEVFHVDGGAAFEEQMTGMAGNPVARRGHQPSGDDPPLTGPGHGRPPLTGSRHQGSHHRDEGPGPWPPRRATAPAGAATVVVRVRCWPIAELPAQLASTRTRLVPSIRSALGCAPWAPPSLPAGPEPSDPASSRHCRESRCPARRSSRCGRSRINRPGRENLLTLGWPSSQVGRARAGELVRTRAAAARPR